MKTGSLYLIPTTLGDNEPLEVLPILVKKRIEEIDSYIAENEKTARRFIKRICPSKRQPSLQFFTLNKFTHETELPNFLEPCLNGATRWPIIYTSGAYGLRNEWPKLCLQRVSSN